MRRIERIKDELGKVWNGEMVIVQIESFSPLTFSFTNLNPIQPETTATFLALSPERIALLVEYYEAVEAQRKMGCFTGGISMEIAMREERMSRIQKARAALEREE